MEQKPYVVKDLLNLAGSKSALAAYVVVELSLQLARAEMLDAPEQHDLRARLNTALGRFV